jgi:hypothetical protein
MNGQSGKGDRLRPVDKKKYDENFERIFGKTQTTKSCDEDPVSGDEKRPDKATERVRRVR